MGLDLRSIERWALRIDSGGQQVGSLVHVGEEQGRADTRFGVKSGAPISMSACSYLEVKRAVHSVLFRSEYRRQMLSHLVSLCL